MSDAAIIDHLARAQIDRLRDSQDQLARDQVKLATLLDVLREQIKRDGEAQAKAMEELFRRVSDAESTQAVNKSRWAMMGAGILFVCSTVPHFFMWAAERIWP